MNPSKITMVLATLAMCTGCGLNSGLVRESVAQIQLREANFHIARADVRAQAHDGAILCMIPVGGQVYTDLMRALLIEARPTRNQMLINLRMDVDRRFYLLYCATNYTLAADVIEFDAAPGP
ncbi:MAG: DUF6567 family protein [Myxococcota bacterium]|jgi:hypothetical protein